MKKHNILYLIGFIVLIAMFLLFLFIIFDYGVALLICFILIFVSVMTTKVIMWIDEED